MCRFGECVVGEAFKKEAQVVEEGVEEGHDKEGEGHGKEQATDHGAAHRGIRHAHHGAVAQGHG